MDNKNVKPVSDKTEEVELYEAFSVEEIEERLDLKSSSSSSKCPLTQKCLAQAHGCKY